MNKVTKADPTKSMNGRPGESYQKYPGQNESFAERIDLLFEELAFAFEQGRPSILLVFYESEVVRERAERALEKRLAENGLALAPFPVDERHFDIPLLLSQRPERDRAVFSVSGFSHAGGKENANAYRALNIRREFFVDYAIRVIIWLAGDEARALSRHAPDFWAFRHRVVEFKEVAEPEHAEPPAWESAGPDWGLPEWKERLDEQIALIEAQLANLPEQAGTITTHLELLYQLAGLYYARKALDQTIHCLQQGKQIARQMNDTTWLARFWGKLALVYLDLEQPLRAVRAGRKATRLNPGEAGLWSNLGHLYHVGKRFSDAIIAYEQALRLDPQSNSTNAALAACYRLLGKNDLAEKHEKLIQG